MYRVIAIALSAFVLAVLAGCGGGTTKTVTVQANAPTATTQSTIASVQDNDNDGTPDNVDADPNDASISTQADVDSAAAVEAATKEETCGDFEDAGKEGLCKDDDGDRYKLVDKGKTLTLPELKASYLGYTTQKTISSSISTESATGTFVIVRLTVTNETDSPVSFEPDNTTLQIGSKTYTPDFDAENSPGDSFVWNSDDLQPEQPKTGTIVFDVPTKRLGKLDSEGLVLLPQFSDDGYDDSSNAAVGALRMYAAG